MYKLAITLVVAGWLATSGPAAAAEMTFITYDLGGSSLVVTAPFAAGPGPVGGTLTIGFESVAGEPVVSGAVSFATWLISANPFSLVVITGSLLIDLTAPMTGGHLDPGNVLNGSGVTGVGTLAGVNHCALTPSLCDAFGIPLTFTLAGPFPLSMGTIAFADFGAFTRVFPFAASIGASVVGTFTFVGTEISRTTVTEMPEPGSGALLLLAAIGLLGGGAWAVRRAT